MVLIFLAAKCAVSSRSDHLDDIGDSLATFRVICGHVSRGCCSGRSMAQMCCVGFLAVVYVGVLEREVLESGELIRTSFSLMGKISTWVTHVSSAIAQSQ